MHLHGHHKMIRLSRERPAGAPGDDQRIVRLGVHGVEGLVQRKLVPRLLGVCLCSLPQPRATSQ